MRRTYWACFIKLLGVEGWKSQYERGRETLASCSHDDRLLKSCFASKQGDWLKKIPHWFHFCNQCVCVCVRELLDFITAVFSAVFRCMVCKGINQSGRVYALWSWPQDSIQSSLHTVLYQTEPLTPVHACGFTVNLTKLAPFLTTNKTVA